MNKLARTPGVKRGRRKIFWFRCDGLTVLRYPARVPNRTPFGPTAVNPPRLPSGWRARLARDPIPILLREGSPALVARVRRDLIADDEAPGPDEVAGYPEVKAFLRKLEKQGSFPAK